MPAAYKPPISVGDRIFGAYRAAEPIRDTNPNPGVGEYAAPNATFTLRVGSYVYRNLASAAVISVRNDQPFRGQSADSYSFTPGLIVSLTEDFVIGPFHNLTLWGGTSLWSSDALPEADSLKAIANREFSLNWTPGRNVTNSVVGRVETVESCGPEAVDPVPTLVDESGVFTPTTTERLEALAGGGRPVTGVVADGATQVVVRISAQATQESVEASVLTDCANVDDPRSCRASQNVDLDGGISLLGGTEVRSTLPLVSRTTTRGPMAFAVYRAPRAIRAGPRDTRALTIYLQFRRSSGSVEYKKLRIEAPLVYLLHGIWSRQSTWDHFAPEIERAGFRVVRGDYSDIAGAAGRIRDVAEKILPDLQAQVERDKNAREIGAVQAIVVAHSMGGLVSRTMVVTKGFASKNNYGLGPVNKLITIDTPHNGSAFANRLAESYLSCRVIFDFVKNPVDEGAVDDLRTDSELITGALRRSGDGSGAEDHLKAHAIVGLANETQVGEMESSWGRYLLAIGCNNVLGFFGTLDGVFEERHDTIVGESSQRAAGLGVVEEIPFTPFDGYFHTVLPELGATGPDVLNRTTKDGVEVGAESPIPGKVVELLLAPRDGELFRAILPAFPK